MMGDKFQLGPFKDVIVGVRQRVTRGTNFFETFFGGRFLGDPSRHCHLPKLSKGYVNTYDWTQNASARDAGTVTLGDLRSIGQHERDAVMSADVVLILLPGGKGTHVELGIAIAQGRRTILHSQDEVINNVETTSTFYHLPELEKCHGSLDDLLAMIVGQEVTGAAV